MNCFEIILTVAVFPLFYGLKLSAPGAEFQCSGNIKIDSEYSEQTGEREQSLPQEIGIRKGPFNVQSGQCATCDMINTLYLPRKVQVQIPDLLCSNIRSNVSNHHFRTSSDRNKQQNLSKYNTYYISLTNILAVMSTFYLWAQ